jgi:hypothetical protein
LIFVVRGIFDPIYANPFSTFLDLLDYLLDGLGELGVVG